MAIFSRKRSLLQSQKLLRRERVWEWTKIVFILVLLGGLVWGLSALSSSSKLTVQNILVSGNSAVPTDDVIGLVRDRIRGNRFLFFSNANIFWYPKNEIAETLQYSYSWIDTVNIKRKNLNTIEVQIKERVPVAVWCGLSEEKPTPCHLVDAEGNLFAKAPEFSGAAYIKLYGPLTSATWRGASFYSTTGLSHILAFVKDLPEIGFRPLIASVASASSYDVTLDSGTRISVQPTDPVTNIISNIDSLLSQKEFAQSQMSNFSNLLYIDARFGNKLFYKFRSATTTKQ